MDDDGFLRQHSFASITRDDSFLVPQRVDNVSRFDNDGVTGAPYKGVDRPYSGNWRVPDRRQRMTKLVVPFSEE